ncbi:DNA alkylation repair protein [Vibrio sp. CB1-14]|uniref:DNA alkylation repair protein n=1 Tax=Vibrio chaetopteri TaxID=3016528 RepID=A0AAU8BRT9_9VIBR
MHDWSLNVKQALVPLKNNDNAIFMKAYMRDQYEFYGIQSGPRRDALKALFSKQHVPA